jgi:hypothetical protein
LKNQGIIVALLIILSSLTLFECVSLGRVSINRIYWLGPIWGLIVIFGLRVWNISRVKIVLILHLVVLLAGLYSFLTYELFKKLDGETPLSSSNFTGVSNLMFESENALYLMAYGGTILLICDAIFLLRACKRRML